MVLVYVSIGVMVVLGLAFGAVLALASKRFAVHMDPRAEQVYDVLPHIDCGACGQAGCRDYAEKAASGELPVDCCVPGGAEIAAKIAAVLGIAYTAEATRRRAVVHCQGGAANAATEFEYDGVPDCRSALLVQGGPQVCKDGCLGFGTCAAACPYGAITMSADHLPVVDEDKCTACGLCVKACPRHLISILDARHRVVLRCSNHDRGKAVKSACRVGCIACGLCVKASQASGAVRLENNLPVIDYDRWTDAEQQASLEKCPMHCYERQPADEGEDAGGAHDEPVATAAPSGSGSDT